MPTGYTAHLLDNHELKFEEFAAICAKAFGCYIHLRDGDPEPTKLSRPTENDSSISYHREALETAKADLKKAQKMGFAARMSFGKKRIASDLLDAYASFYERVKVHDVIILKIQEVRLWDAPEKHLNLKNFMINQLTSTLDYDGDYKGYPMRTIESLLTADPLAVWQTHIDALKNSVEYHERGLTTEKDRQSERLSWIDDLSDSVKDHQRFLDRK